MIKSVGEIPENMLLVAADVVILYPSISQKACPSALKEALNKRTVQEIPIESLVKMAEFVK